MTTRRDSRTLAARAATACFLAITLLLAACDPLLTIQGSFWPPWFVCIFSGLVLTAGLSLLFSLLRLDPYLGHPLIIYTSLWALMTFTVWLIGYG